MWTVEFSEKNLSRFLSVAPFPAGEQGYGHAYCFHGYEVANLFYYTSAWMNSIFCHQTSESGLACGLCAGCQIYRKRNPVYFHPVFPKGNAIPIDSIRELSRLQQRLQQNESLLIPVYFPMYLQKEAANAFLKILEEPAEGRIFILINPGCRMLMSTISSRVLHVNLPSGAAVFDLSSPADNIAMRMSDYNFAAEPDRINELLSREDNFSAFLTKNYLEPFQNNDFNGDVFENMIFTQLCKPEVAAGRKVTALLFLSGLCTGEYDYLEDELAELRTAVDNLQRFLLAQGREISAEMSFQLRAGYTHYFAGQFTGSDINSFWRGFIIREFESFFHAIARELEFLFMDRRKKFLLPLEDFMAAEFSALSSTKSLSRINSELVNAVQMLYNNLPWEQVLENMGLNILQMIREW